MNGEVSEYGTPADGVARRKGCSRMRGKDARIAGREFSGEEQGGDMGYSGYPYSALTQAEFYKAEAELIRFGERLAHSPSAKCMKDTLLAIDAIFAIRMSHDVTLPAVPLITAFDLSNWKYRGDANQGIRMQRPEFRFPDGCLNAALQAIHYMQAIEWATAVSGQDAAITMETVLHLHEILLSGKTGDNRYHGFRSNFLPHKKGSDPTAIPLEISELCAFASSEAYSPLGQASIIHWAFERIVPFDTMIDRTGLVLAFMPMFRRGLFSNGYMVPVCWGASIGREYRRKLKDSSRVDRSAGKGEDLREHWAVYNAQNTYMSVVVADSFLAEAEKLSAKWRSQNLRIPAHSALDKLLDLLLGNPGLSTIRAAELIGKSYGATNEAIRQLARAGIVKEVAVDGRERIFVCRQSAAMITDFVESLVKMGDEAESSGVRC